MPTIITTPKPGHQRDRDEDRLPGNGDHGSGHRPPTDKRTGGNGEGDNENWDARPAGSRGPRERLTQCRIGLACALAADTLFFIAIISTFLVTKHSYHIDAYNRVINSWLPTALPSILWLNTAVLVLSSATAELARRSMFREQDVMDEWFGLGKPTSRRATLWLSFTLFFGTLFLLGQYAAWQQLAAQHVYFGGGASAHFFYLFTVAHAIHLFLGVAALIGALAALGTSRRFALRQILVDTTVWYWHAMGLLWIAIFVLLEYFQ